jgi:hypothetical protein
MLNDVLGGFGPPDIGRMAFLMTDWGPVGHPKERTWIIRRVEKDGSVKSDRR